MSFHARFAIPLLVSFWFACSSATTPFEELPPSDVTPTESPEASAERARLRAEIAALESLDADALLADRTVPFEPLGYDPSTAINLDLVQESSFALEAPELSRLSSDGFVVVGRRTFPAYGYGYHSIYAEDLPVFISADSILEAVHRSYDDILTDVEVGQIIPELTDLIASMRRELAGDAGRAIDEDARAHVDLYLAVAHGLLAGESPTCVAGCAEGEARQLFGMASAHEGTARVTLFGSARDEDFSQYKPRGHYADDPVLSRYFAAMMWLGRVDFRIIETQPDHSQVFRRRQLEAALGLRSLLDETRLAQFASIDAIITAFVGEHDYMQLHELDLLLEDLGITDASGLGELSDAEIAQAIFAGNYGTQRISSHIMLNGTRLGTMPLSSSFAFFGQRYVVDSHVFSNVVYDRVNRGAPFRVMPSPADVLYAALGNDQAASFLEDDLRAHRFAPDLEAMRLLVDAHGEAYWKQDIYTTWLGALRTLSPSADGLDPELPSVARTEPWGRRLATTQLASWAELRRDTILYAKQSYTSDIACEFPDGYVEPYPEFFDAIAELARRGAAAMSTIAVGSRAHEYFVRLEGVANTLGDMARHQRSGAPFDAEQLAFLNRAVIVQELCGAPPYIDGWYADLHFNPHRPAEWDPTIADVHTQPADESGVRVGRVLHVATGAPRQAVFTFETCSGPRAYVGLVSSYYEKITEDFTRLTDQEWSAEIGVEGYPPEPEYLGGVATP